MESTRWNLDSKPDKMDFECGPIKQKNLKSHQPKIQSIAYTLEV
jgi:hypothetical protein